MKMKTSIHPGLLLDPYLSVNPCCCCCGDVPITKGIRTIGAISMVLAIGYCILGVWFAFKALIMGDQPILKENKIPDEAELEAENLLNILLICGVSSFSSGTIRFLSSYYLYRSVQTEENKLPAKIWCVMTFGFVIVVTAVVLAASQKNEEFFQSIAIDLFLSLALVDFILLLYFLWIIIVYVKEEMPDMPPSAS